MASRKKTPLGTKILMGFGMFCFAFGIFDMLGFVPSPSKKDNSDGVNLDNIEQVREAIQGKWNESLPSSVSSQSLYFRLEIVGTEVRIWEKVGFNDWKMGEPDEVHAVTIGEKTKTVDGDPCRYLFWDEETLLTRSIGTLHVTDCCILFHGSVRILNKGWN